MSIPMLNTAEKVNPFEDPTNHENFLRALDNCIGFAIANSRNVELTAEAARALWNYLSSIWFGGSGAMQVGAFYEVEGWLEKPLPAGQPRTWTERERRVEWLRANLTTGEQAMLYRLAHDVDRLRVADCKGVERAEKEKCGAGQP